MTSTFIGKTDPEYRQEKEEASSELNDIVEKILLNVESRQPMLHNSQNNKNSKLSIQELEQLSLLSSNYHSNQASTTLATLTTLTTCTATNNKVNGNNTNNVVTKFGWATVNIDSLCELCKLLEDHIHNASRVDFIKFAREAFDEVHDGNGGSLRGRDRQNEMKENLEQVREKEESSKLD